MRRIAVYVTAAATVSLLIGGAASPVLGQQNKPMPLSTTQGGTSPKTELIFKKEFVQLFANYAAAVQGEGVAGVKSFAAPNFALRSKGVRPLTGDAAFKEMAWYDDAKRLEYGITVSRLVTTGDTFTAVVSESIGIGGIPQQEDSAKFRVTSATATWLWKQTWRKTPSGWKLAVWEQIDNKPSGFSFTIKIPAAKPAKNAP